MNRIALGARCALVVVAAFVQYAVPTKGDQLRVPDLIRAVMRTAGRLCALSVPLV